MSNQQLQTAIEAQNKIDIERVINEVKGSALARSNWEQLVSSVPIALRCLGLCSMAASSKDVRHIQVPQIPGATLDKLPGLASNLVRCSDLGADALLRVGKFMEEICHLSHMNEKRVFDITGLLGGGKAAARQLPSALRMLQENVDKCYETSKEIDDVFSVWLLFTKELYEACQSRSSIVTDEAAKAIIEKAAATTRIIDTESQMESTKQSIEELGRMLDISRRVFIKASESQPNGWDLIGQHLVMGIGQAVIGGVNAFISKIGDNKSKNDSGNSQNGANDQGDLGTRASKNSFPSISDPAYAAVTRDLYLYELLKSMVKDKNGEVDWDLALGGSKNSTNSGVGFIETMLKQSRSDFATQTSGGLATTTYKKILDDAIKVTEEIGKSMKKNERPQRSSGTVSQWQTLTDSLYESVYTLKLRNQNSAFSPAASNGALPDHSLEPPRVDAGLSHSQALLAAAAANLKTTADTLDSTNKLYGENVKRLSEQQNNLMEIDAVLTKLTAGNIGLEEYKQILLQCIGLIVQLKARIVDLVDFFGTLATVVKTVSNKLVAQWLETIKIAGSISTIKVGEYSLESTEATMIMNGLTCIAAYFSFFAEVTISWRDAAGQYIHPGVGLVESLSMGDNVQGKKDMLQKWSQDASDQIRKILEHKRREIQDGMTDRATGARDILKQLPPPSTAVEKVTQNVLPALMQADVKAIEAENNNSAVAILTGKRRVL